MDDEGRYRLYPFAGGVIYLNLDESPMMRRRAEGTYEPHKVTAIQAYARPGMTFADAGANKGDFTLIAAREVGPTGGVLAFEPSPQNCRWIGRSIDANGYRNVRLHEVALSDSDGEAVLHLGARSGWHSLRPSERATGETVSVTTRSLDSVLGELGDVALDMLKVDVEGAELEVLRGATEALGGRQPLFVMVDIHPEHGVDPREVCELLTAHGLSLREPEDPSRPISDAREDLSEVFAVRAWPGL
jgi:FkbM family methyltransferase